MSVTYVVQSHAQSGEIDKLQRREWTQPRRNQASGRMPKKANEEVSP
jgi:hypothetical protein